MSELASIRQRTMMERSAQIQDASQYDLITPIRPTNQQDRIHASSSRTRLQYGVSGGATLLMPTASTSTPHHTVPVRTPRAQEPVRRGAAPLVQTPFTSTPAHNMVPVPPGAPESIYDFDTSIDRELFDLNT